MWRIRWASMVGWGGAGDGYRRLRCLSSTSTKKATNLSDSLLVLPTARRSADELGVVAGTVRLTSRRHGSGSVGFFRAVDGGGYDSVALLREKYNGVAVRCGPRGRDLADLWAGSTANLVHAVAADYRRFRAETNVDFVVIEGLWAPGHSQGFLQEVNARVAAELGSAVITGVDGKDASAAEVGSFCGQIVGEMRRRHVQMAGVFVVHACSAEAVEEELRRRKVPCIAVMPVDRLLSSATLQDVADYFDGEILCGKRLLQYPIDLHRTTVAVGNSLPEQSRSKQRRHCLPKAELLSALRRLGGRASVQQLADAVDGIEAKDLRPVDFDGDGCIRSRDVIDYTEGDLVLCSADRGDIVTSVLLSELGMGRRAGRYTGVLVCGDTNQTAVRSAVHRAREASHMLSQGHDLNPSRADGGGGAEVGGVDGRSSGGGGGGLPPVLALRTDVHGAVTALRLTEPRMTMRSTQKLNRTIANFEAQCKQDDLLAGLRAPSKDLLTPSMFQYQFHQRAKKAQRRIVLPEGTEPRIVLAAGELLRDGIAHLTLLGKPAEVQATAAQHGVVLDSADIVDPADSPLFERYVDRFVELRKSKGATEEMARDILLDANYFGTMMVKCEDADGMVSGSVHTTAATVRPALQLIKTKPGISIVSSVFFMCLPDKVLVYGDCAINPSPTADQLAQIAVTSAHTTAQFGIEPRVALLSFSSLSADDVGDSPEDSDDGAEPEVQKVSEAVRIARRLAPELTIFGPIQYDAAVDDAIARGKGIGIDAPANVIIFPDLNTGNIGYKAVQQSTGAIAVGPVLQGLNKPVNDLSRGAKVADIVNTVAITACMA